jgi:sugar lactone lactonase YvrE
MKSDSNGNVSWLAQINGPGIDIGYSIATDSTGNVYVTGSGAPDVVLTAFNANGTAFGTTIANSGNNDAFVVKYDTNGSVQWVARLGSTNIDIGYGIATDSSGNVYVSGAKFGAILTAFNSDGTAFGTTLPNFPVNDVFIVKYNTNGFVQWIARVGSTSDDIGYAIATDAGGNVYVTGQAGTSGINTTAFNADGTSFGTVIPNTGFGDAFVVKYNTSGFVQWVAKVASTNTDTGFGIATDSGGNVYVTGQGGNGVVVTAFSSNGVAFGTTLANSGASDVFIVKYDTSGIVQWVARVASTGNDIGYAIATDSGGNVYVTGQGGSGVVVTAFSSSGVAFGTTLANLGGSDTFLVKYDTSGTVQWVARVASVDPDIGYGIKTDSAGNVYVTGLGYTSTTAFNADGTRFGFAISRSSTSAAGFVVKYNTSGVVQWIMTTSGVGTEQGRGIAIDGSSNIYSTGFFNGSYLVPYDA